MSATTTRLYWVYALTVDPSELAPWRWDRWSGALPALDRLFADPATAVRSFQNDDGKNRPSKIRGETILGGYVRFGRLRWTDASHRKWTHESPSTAGASEKWRFFHTDFALPSLATFDKTRVPPSVYGKLTGSRKAFNPDGTLKTYPSSLFVAVATDHGHATLVEPAMREVARVWNAAPLARRQRTWANDASTALPLPAGFAVTASMQDCAFAPPSDRALAEAEGWEVLAGA